MPRCSELAGGALALAVALLSACDLGRPDSQLICHNANCVEPTAPEDDDTLDAMRASLALTYDDRPALDGIEIDSFWSAADDACLFAHDLERAERVPALDAARELAAYLAVPGEVSYSGRPFRVVIELKGHVGPATRDRHTMAELERHASCALEMYDVIVAGALEGGHEVELVFASFEPALLGALSGALAANPTPPLAPIAFAAIQGIPQPLDDQTHSLDEYGQIDLSYVEVHPQWLSDSKRAAIRSADLELIVWSFEMTAETLDAIERDEPVMVESSEARFMRRWLDD